jgi:hypothetical protein
MNLQELPTATPFASSSIPDEKLAFPLPLQAGVTRGALVRNAIWMSEEAAKLLFFVANHH